MGSQVRVVLERVFPDLDVLKVDRRPSRHARQGVFDEYLYADEKHQGFYEKYQAGESLNAGWVNESDFEDTDLEE